MKRLLTLFLTIALFAGITYAHNGMQHVMGTVAGVTDTSISVKTMSGTVQSVALSGDTKYLRGDAAIILKDIKIGDHIVIHATKKDGQLTAAEVKVGAMKRMSGMNTSRNQPKPQE